MGARFDVSRLERNTWAMMFQSGLTDIMIGLIFVLSTIISLFDHLRYILYPLFLFPAVLYFVAWKWIVIPRQGIITFSATRRRKNLAFFLAITIPLAGLVGLKLFNLPDHLSTGTWSVFSVFAVILIIFFSIAFFLNFIRMYCYGLLAGFSFLLGEALRPHSELLPWKDLAFLPAALVMTGIGIILIIRFIKAYPLPMSGAKND